MAGNYCRKVLKVKRAENLNEVAAAITRLQRSNVAKSLHNSLLVVRWRETSLFSCVFCMIRCVCPV